MAKTTLVQNETTPTQLNITALSSAGYATSGTQDGDPILADDINDYKGFASAVLNDNGITASGTPDTQANSQVYQGLNKKFDQIRYKTLSEAIAEDAPVGTRYVITDLDNARYDVVLAGDTGGLYQTGMSSGRKLKYIEIAGTSKRTIPLSHIGNYLNQDITAISNSIATYLGSSGGGLILYPIGTFLCSDTITLPNKVIVSGGGIGRTLISATNAMTALIPVFYSDSNYCTLSDFSIIGNTDGVNGAGHGISLKGTHHEIKRVYVSNTTQAGIRLEDPSHCKVHDVILEGCGRSGYTDNHGVMLFTLGTATLAANEVMHCTIANTNRKGIATYAPTGSVRGLIIGYNTIYGSGLGDIFIGGPDHTGVDIHHNICTGGAVSLQAQIQDSRVAFNTFETTSNDFCIGGYDLHNVTFIGNITKGAATSALKVFSPAGETNSYLTVLGNDFRNSSRNNAGAPIIELVNTTDSTFSLNKLVEDGIGQASYGIYEHVGCDRNLFSRNTIKGVTVENYNVSGADTVLEYADTSEMHKGLALVNGQNNNVDVTVGAGSVTITGPTADYSITGVTGGRLGRTIKLVNSTAHNLTLVIASGASTAGNRLYLSNSVDKVIPAWGTVELTYVNNQGSLYWCDF